jgi:CO/xanthine dehydrogenase Mo-binding subunit
MPRISAADGMVFCRLLTSPMPHARVKNIDAAAALKMEGVLGMLTADDIPAGPPGFAPSLAKEPMYVGEPILAVAALSEQAAEDAIAAIKIDYEPLPFTHDPLESLFPGGKDARGDGFNIGTLAGLPPGKIKWAAADFARVKQGEQLPMGKPAEEWNFGDVEAEFKKCKVVYDEPFVTASLAITAWSRAPRWPTGRTASASCTRRCRASRSRCRRWRRCWGSSPRKWC